MSACPTPGTIDSADWPRMNWLVAQKSIKFCAEVTSALIAARRLLFQTLKANRLQITGHVRVEEPRRYRLGVQDLLQSFCHALGNERRPPCQHVKQNRTQRINIPGRRHGLAFTQRLLG